MHPSSRSTDLDGVRLAFSQLEGKLVVHMQGSTDWRLDHQATRSARRELGDVCVLSAKPRFDMVDELGSIVATHENDVE